MKQANAMIRRMERIHGKGFWDTLKKGASAAWGAIKPLAKSALQEGIKYATPALSNLANQYLPGVGGAAVEGLGKWGSELVGGRVRYIPMKGGRSYKMVGKGIRLGGHGVAVRRRHRRKRR